jgi:hypothetical protein
MARKQFTGQDLKISMLELAKIILFSISSGF